MNEYNDMRERHNACKNVSSLRIPGITRHTLERSKELDVMKMVTCAAFGLAVSLAAFGSASAAPVTFTWNPTGIGLTTQGVGSNIVANNITVADYADIVIPGATFTENAVIVFKGFDLSGNPAVYTPPALSPNFNGLGASYSFYATIVATGTTPGVP